MENENTQPITEPSKSDYDKVKDIDPFDIAKGDNVTPFNLKRYGIDTSRGRLRVDVIKKLLVIDYSPEMIELGEEDIQQDINTIQAKTIYYRKKISEKREIPRKDRLEEESILPQETLKSYRDSYKYYKQIMDMYENHDWLAIGNLYLDQSLSEYITMQYHRNSAEGMPDEDAKEELQESVGRIESTVVMNLLKSRVCAERAIKRDLKLKQKVADLPVFFVEKKK